MAVTRNERSYEGAKEPIAQGRFVPGDRAARSGHRPSTRQENAFVDQHGIGEYRKRFLGTDTDEIASGSTEAVSYPRPPSAARAGQDKDDDIEVAAAHRRGLLDTRPQAAPPVRKDK